MLLVNVNTECLNFRLATGFDLKPKNICSWIFLAIDNSIGDLKPATFAIHFGEAWTAKVFKAVVDAVLSELPAGQNDEQTTAETVVEAGLSGLTAGPKADATTVKITVDVSLSELPAGQTTATKEKTTKTLEMTIDSALSGLTTVDASALESPMSQVS